MGDYQIITASATLQLRIYRRQCADIHSFKKFLATLEGLESKISITWLISGVCVTYISPSEIRHGLADGKLCTHCWSQRVALDARRHAQHQMTKTEHHMQYLDFTFRTKLKNM